MRRAKVVPNFMRTQCGSIGQHAAKAALRNAVRCVRRVTNCADICDSYCATVKVFSGKHVREIACGRSTGSEAVVVVILKFSESSSGPSKCVGVVICGPYSLKNDTQLNPQLRIVNSIDERHHACNVVICRGRGSVRRSEFK